MGLLRSVTGGFSKLRVDVFENQFLVNYAQSIGANYIIRGIRTASDYEYERTMRYINSDLHPDITTIFLLPPREYAEVSSTMVKGLVGPRGWESVIRQYLPEPVYRKLIEMYSSGIAAAVIESDIRQRAASSQRRVCFVMPPLKSRTHAGRQPIRQSPGQELQAPRQMGAPPGLGCLARLRQGCAAVSVRGGPVRRARSSAGIRYRLGDGRRCLPRLDQRGGGQPVRCDRRGAGSGDAEEPPSPEGRQPV